jgi:DNA mismatch endonuclease (patch repair protein)
VTDASAPASPEGPSVSEKEPSTEASGSSPTRRSRPKPLDAAVAAQMSRMPRRDTKPELQIRRLLHARGLRYRVDDKRLPGRPDIVFAGARLAVFVDGCFWHACPEHGVLPKNNRDWWQAKLAATVGRDRRKDENLWMLGWDVLHVWEHEDAVSAADRVASAVASKSRRRAP